MSQSKPPRETKSPRASAAVVAELMMPAEMNNNGTVFGGALVSLIDRCGGVVARKHSRGNTVVTVCIDRVEFHEPVYAGEYVVARGRLVRVGISSMDILVTIDAENLETGLSRRTNECLLTFVALGEDGRPTPVPALLLETDEDRALAQEAEEWRTLTARYRTK